MGPSALRSILARCSIVNQHGKVIYDKYVTPSEEITDYRTHVSGIKPGFAEEENVFDFDQVQREVKGLLKNRILVGHSLESDLQALMLSHPKKYTRDTAKFTLLCPHRPLSLKALVREKLHVSDFQNGEHDSVEDARAALCLYDSVKQQWEERADKKSHKLHRKSYRFR